MEYNHRVFLMKSDQLKSQFSLYSQNIIGLNFFSQFNFVATDVELKIHRRNFASAVNNQL